MNNKRGILFALLTALMLAVMVPSIMPGKNNAASVEAKKARISKSRITLRKGGTFKLFVRHKKKKIRWHTSNAKIATVSRGKVTAKGIGNGQVRANVCVAKSEAEARENFRQGDILVMSQTSNEIMDLLKKASGIIVSSKGADCHAAIVGLTLDIPVLVGACGCTNVLRSGTMIILDAEKGIVCNIVS